jgi:hypothetical protein
MIFKMNVYDRVQLWQMQHYQPYDRNWNDQTKLYDKWISYSTNVFKNTICYAICGLTKLNHHHKHFKKLNSMYYNIILMNLNVHFMALLIVDYLIT